MGGRKRHGLGHVAVGGADVLGDHEEVVGPPPSLCKTGRAGEGCHLWWPDVG